MRLCTCQSCSLETAIDPISGKLFLGQYIGDSAYKDHQRSQNARILGASHLGILQVNPPLLSQEPSNQPLNTHVPLFKVENKMESDSRPTADLPSNTSDTLLLRLTSIEERCLHYDLQGFMSSTKVVFRYPPSQRSTPMTTPDPDVLALDETVPVNSDIVKEERWLHSALELTEIIQLRSSEVHVKKSAKKLHERLVREQKTLERLKMKQWEALRRGLAGMSARVRVVDTGSYLSRPFAHLNPSIVLCYVIVAFMHLVAGISLKYAKILLLGLVKLLALCNNQPNHALPHDVGTLVHHLIPEPRTKAYVCCPKCFTLYTYDPDTPSFPEQCSFKRTATTPPCGARLITKKQKSKKGTPVRLFLYHELQDWIASLYARPDIEELLDRDLLHHESEDTWDVHDAPELRQFLGPENDPQRPFLRRPGNEGRLVFSLNMDGFNPLMNKESGKKISVGAIYLVCLNLPPAIRYDIENILLVGVIPGPHEPSKDEINHVLHPLVDDLLILWSHGYWLTSTTKYPHGRLTRGAVIPLVCDLPAARQMSGFASHNSRNFCSCCGLSLDDIDDFDYENWPSRNVEEHRRLAQAWKDAPSEAERDKLYDEHGVRWSELLRLPYWDPTRFVLIDSMHGFFLRMFQRHCRQIWGMSVDIEDGDYPSFSQDKIRPSEEAMEKGHKVLRWGNERALAGLKTPVLRELARSTNCLPYGGRAKKLVKELLAYRVRRGWATEDGNIIESEEDAKNPSETLGPNVTESLPVAPVQAQPKRDRKDPATKEEITTGLKIIDSGTKSGLRSLRKNVLIKLCELKNIEMIENPTVSDLLDCLGQWRFHAGIVDGSGNLRQRIRKNTGPRKKNIGVLGRETLHEIQRDMEDLELPSWVSPAPRHPGEARRGKFTADQWRSFCMINLPLTLSRLWGQEDQDSRKRLMLDNFMHLVAAVKLATMRCMTPERISRYVFHIHEYLKNLLQLYPATTISPYQHLALHIQDFLRRFGPVHSWRCFPFERYNYLLQNIPTNMKLGELEATLLKRFCGGQQLRRLLQPQAECFPEDLHDLLTEWEQLLKSDIRGTLLGDAFSFDDSFRQEEERPTWAHDEQKHLSEAWYSLLKAWVSRHDVQADLSSLSRFAYHRKKMSRLGETYQATTASPRDSRVYFLGAGGATSTGVIIGIFSHTRPSTSDKGDQSRTQTFFIVKEYEPLPQVYEEFDPYRRFADVTGRLYCDTFLKGERIISCEELLYHFALTRINIRQIPIPCVLALPLDKS